MKQIYRNSGSFPAPTWKKSKKIYNKSGKWGRASTGHSSNALVSVMKPSEGLYSLCIGPAKRGLTPNSPHWASMNPIYNETNAFWEIKLSKNPIEMLQDAINKTKADLSRAKSQLIRIEKMNENYEYLYSLIEEAGKELEILTEFSDEKIEPEKLTVFSLSRYLRATTRAQVKAKQVINLTSKKYEKN